MTPITNEKDIVSSSAYVLFYIRKDLQHSRFHDIHKIPPSLQTHLESSQSSQHQQQYNLNDNSGHLSENSESKSDSLITMLGNEAKNKLNRLIPTNKIITKNGAEENGSQQNNENNENENIGINFPHNTANNSNETDGNTCVQS